MPALHFPSFLAPNSDIQKFVGAFSSRPSLNRNRKFSPRRFLRKVRDRPFRVSRVFCVAEEVTKLHQIRKYCPVLESTISANNNVTTSEWKAVPDIWKTSADKYGNKVALIDPYHDPPSTLTYKQEDLQRYQPHYLISVPLVYETLYSGIYRQISASSRAGKIIALSFIRISLIYMEFRRIFEGNVLPRTMNQHSSFLSVLLWLWAGAIRALLWPLHGLGSKLVYTKIRSAVGITKAGISGGGSLPLHIDKFFEAIGITLQNGYGLTETSPVVAARRLKYNVLGTVGHPLRSTEIKIVDLETGRDLRVGMKGIVKVRGPQVMKGYYMNEDATSKVLDHEGWFYTGDIGWIVPSYSTGPSRNCGGMLVLEGRAKDTIVLSTGENVEPSEIEEAAIRSSLIQQIIVIGQDQRRIGALIVPNKEELFCKARSSTKINGPYSNLSREIVTKLIRNELTFWTSKCSFHIGPFLLLDEPFTVDNGLLTPTLKIRRDKVMAKYKDEIMKLYN